MKPALQVFLRFVVSLASAVALYLLLGLALRLIATWTGVTSETGKRVAELAVWISPAGGGLLLIVFGTLVVYALLRKRSIKKAAASP